MNHVYREANKTVDAITKSDYKVRCNRSWESNFPLEIMVVG